MEVKVYEGQSILDFAIQHTGSVVNAFLIAKENSLAVSAYLVPGYELVIPEGVAFQREIKNYYDTKGIKPATVNNTETIIVKGLSGIGYWAIEEDFIVS